jgi:hypothetical protein
VNKVIKNRLFPDLGGAILGKQRAKKPPAAAMRVAVVLFICA